MTRYYAGIGSRQTPKPVLDLMRSKAQSAANHGWILRTGGADGADNAFLNGITSSGFIELYLPWPSYNGHHYPTLARPTAAAVEMAAKYHPAWEKCSRAARLLHGRNMHIMLGPQLDTPVDLVVCWTPGGRITGGTGQALRLAKALKIPVCNLYNRSDLVARHQAAQLVAGN